VLGFSFDIDTGELTTLVIGALGVPLLGEGVLSTWEMPVGEVVSSGPDRIIVYEGAEEKLKQLGTGLLEKLGIGGASWEQEERDRYRGTMVPVENQLAAGVPSVQEQQSKPKMRSELSPLSQYPTRQSSRSLAMSTRLLRRRRPRLLQPQLPSLAAVPGTPGL
jgi:hypothetical protein